MNDINPKSARPEKLSARLKEKYQAHREARIEKQSLYYYAHREKILEAGRKKRAENPEAFSERKRREHQRNKSKPFYTIGRSLRLAVQRINRKVHFSKPRAEEMLGCPMETARAHIESLFKPGMTWENHGRYTWHIDHIKPLAAFDLSDPAQVLTASHYTNLQPLWAKDNLTKNAKY